MRYFKILYTALLIKLLSIVITDFCGCVTSKPYNITGKQNDCSHEQTRVLTSTIKSIKTTVKAYNHPILLLCWRRGRRRRRQLGRGRPTTTDSCRPAFESNCRPLSSPLYPGCRRRPLRTRTLRPALGRCKCCSSPSAG